jgi:hypothetical protein
MWMLHLQTVHMSTATLSYSDWVLLRTVEAEDPAPGAHAVNTADELEDRYKPHECHSV